MTRKKLSAKHHSLCIIIFLLVCSAATYERNILWSRPVLIWEDAAKKSPRKARIFSNLGYAYLKEKKYKESIEQSLAAIQRDPEMAEAYFNLGAAYHATGDTEKAIKQYLIALQRLPDQPDNHLAVKVNNNLGLAYLEQHQINQAIERYKSALRFNATYGDTYYNLGVAYTANGNIDYAIEQYKISLSLDPWNYKAHMNLGLLYLEKGALSEARIEFTTASHINPASGQANMFINYIDSPRPQ